MESITKNRQPVQVLRAIVARGRLEIGLGPRLEQTRHDAIGLPFEPVGVRIRRLTEAITIVKGCFADGPFTFTGEHYTVTGHDGVPKPAQRPHPPLFLGGGGKRLLTLAAQQAQIIGLAPRLIPGDHPRLDARGLTAAATEEKISWNLRGRRRPLRRTGTQHLPHRRPGGRHQRPARRGTPPRRRHPRADRR